MLLIPPKPLEERLTELGIINPIPAHVTATILACLAKEPADRPSSIKAVAEALGLAETPAVPAEAKPLTAGKESYSGHHRGLFVALAVAVVVAVLTLLAIKFMAGK